MKRPLAIHPLLFAIFPILFLFAHNRAEFISYSEILLPAAIVLGFALLLLLLCWFSLRDANKAGIIVSIFLLLFFSYGHVYDALSDWRLASVVVGQHSYLIPTWIILLACGLYFTVRTAKDLRILTKILNVIAASLVLVSLLNIGFYEFKTRGTWANTGRSTNERAAIGKDSGNTAAPRDIYFIVLDGYASSSTLKEIYGYDNHEFTDYLAKQGFSITSQSRANYALTYLSLSSSLNMGYINYLTNRAGAESRNRKVTYQLVRDSKVLNSLKSKGYKVIHFSSGWRETNHNQYADLNIKCGTGDEFSALLIQTTILGCFEQNLIGRDARGRVLGTFSKLGQMPRVKGPKFVFAHILVPHPPYLFDSNGKPVKGTELKMCGRVWLEKENYLNQLKFVNKKVKVLVDKILSESEVPPIIIMQSDHGSASIISQHHSRGWNHPTEEMFQERMSIFSSYYLPQDGNDLLYDSITPVNNFRLIFNSYFDADYEFLDDQSYFSSYQTPYKFTNVTNKAKYD